MIRVGLLYDSISENTGDKAIGISLQEFCERNNFDYEIVNPFDVDPARYSTLLIGGGHLIRDLGDEFYDNFRVKGPHVLVSAGLTTDKNLEYLNDYQFVSVRSQREHDIVKQYTNKARVMPDTTLLMSGDEQNSPKLNENSIGIHVTSYTLTVCPEISKAITEIDHKYKKVYFPFTHYNKDRAFMESSGVISDEDLLLSELSPKALFSTIGNFKFLVTSSLHATIFAYAQNIPFAAVYQEKIYDFLKDRGLENLVFRNTSELIERINLLQTQETDFTKAIQEDKKTVTKGLDEIKTIIESDGETFELDKGSRMKKDQIRLKTPEKNLKINQLQEVIKGRDDALSSLNNYFIQEVNTQLEQINELEGKLAKSRSDVAALNHELSLVHSSRGWRAIITIRQLAEPLKRKTPRVIKKAVKITFRFLRQAFRSLPLVETTKNTIQIELKRREIQTERAEEYHAWYSKNKPNETELAEQKRLSQEFEHRPLISIIMPTYNTDTQHLQECIDSVLEQTYEHWELCIADDASSKQEVKDTIKRYAQQDERIRYVLREENGHICHASNSALELASGECVSLLDHDDVLWPNALFEITKLINEHPAAGLIYTDEDKIEEDGITHSEPFFKPDWSPDYLRTINYITHFTTIRKSLVDEIGGFRPGCEGAQDWDLILRASNATQEIYHIPKIVYSWRKSANSTAQAASSKDYAYTNQRGVLEEDLQSRGYEGEVIEGKYPGYWRVKYSLEDKPLVSIVIPTKDRYEYIKTCLKSLKKTSYKNLEVVIVDTGSEDPKVWKLYDQFKRSHKQTKVVKWSDPFNFASVCNYGAQEASGDYLLFLNNDTEVITRDWVEGLLEHAQRPEAGAVGCKLLYPDKRIQHAGVILGVGGTETTPGIAGHYFQLYNDEPMEDPAQNIYIGGVRDFMAVTAACLLVDREKFEAAEGFDPDFQIAFNDIDFCLKLHDKGWNNIYTPHVKLYHHESISVGKPGTKNRDTKVFDKEIALMGERWGWELINNDPYYHPEFSRHAADARLRSD